MNIKVIMGDDKTGVCQELVVLSTYTVKGVLHVDVQAPPEPPLCECQTKLVDQMVEDFVEGLSGKC